MIDQIYFPSKFLHFNKKDSPMNQKLKLYYDVNKPSFFYSTWCLDYIKQHHNSLAIMIVNNSTVIIENNLDWIKSNKKIFFISTSKLMSNYLDNLGLTYIEFPWHHGTIDYIDVHPKGHSIYFYGSDNLNFYGYQIVEKIIKENFPHLNVIYTKGKSNKALLPFVNYSEDELNDIYKKVFLCVRLTRFDGLSETVQSLGLRGIKTIWNGGTPSALSYESAEDIISHIKNEEATINTIDLNLAKACYNYLNPYNIKYDYIFDLFTYINNHNTPKLFFNEVNLTHTPISDLVKESYNINQKLKV